MNVLAERATVGSALRQLKQALTPLDASHEARLLLCAALGCTDSSLILQKDRALTEDERALLAGMLSRRLSGEPLQYILGEWDFMGYPIAVNEAVLIPRSDTECVVERAGELARAAGLRTALDLCTGSGCIAVALERRYGLAVTASDVSAEALAVAERNLHTNRCQATLVQSDLFEHINGPFDLIVSNPPYIPDGDIDGLQREVKDHEPHLALCGGTDGLDFYRRIAKEALEFLTPGGALVLEVGDKQAQDVAALLAAAGFLEIQCTRDLCGVWRAVEGRAPERTVHAGKTAGHQGPV